ncbi:MAG: ribose 5-phosphate isomerase B [Candidatus Aminicenantes bacterium]|nr:ribose 5-phosphate isomerase B [Candidatus Aminicenantes bacterium]MDH5715763.1 ribose 5-phosphate isomerase B [Candidatus Aminicenantes bacterium]
MMKVALGSDHAGFELKEAAKEVLEEMGVEYNDLGVHSYKRVDYVPYGKEVALGVADGKYDRGILFCGSGIGMSIVANKIAGIRAALCHEPYTARLSREHNDANVLVLAGRTTGPGIAAEIIRVWLTTPFAGGRHQKRLDQVKELEK